MDPAFRKNQPTLSEAAATLRQFQGGPPGQRAQIICSWVKHSFSSAHNPAAWLRDPADESAQPMLVRISPFNRGPSDTLNKMIKGLFWQILKEH
jgi:hypothetical protein